MRGLPIKPEDWRPSKYITDEVLEHYQYLIEKGKIDDAVEWIASFYPQKIAYIVMQTTKKILMEGIESELTAAEMTKVTADLGMLFRYSSSAITEGVRLFTTEVIADYYFKNAGLTNKKLQQKVLDACLGQFKSYVNGTMANTLEVLLADVRAIQLEWIKRNINIRNSKSVDDLLYKSEAEFRKMLKTKYPNLFDAIEKGEILKSRSYITKAGDIKHKSYTLEEYTDFSVRATILNIDRNSTEMAVHERNHKVVEFYLRDTRPVKTEEREVCKHILAKKVHGKSLLALTDEAANALGIMTIERARSEGAMYIHCRHSIKPVDDEFNDQIEKIIALNESVDGKKQEEE